MQWNPHNTSVAEIHYIVCDDAVEFANGMVAADNRIPNKWKGPVFRNDSPYSNDAIALRIAEEYQGAPDRVKNIYRQTAVRALRWAISKNQEIFVGMIFGEAREGRNYFSRWAQAPERLF